MTEADRLRRELRAAREELVRKQYQREDAGGMGSNPPLMPDRDAEFLRLALMTEDELETHIDRLERDLADLKHGIDVPEE